MMTLIVLLYLLYESRVDIASLDYCPVCAVKNSTEQLIIVILNIVSNRYNYGSGFEFYRVGGPPPLYLSSGGGIIPIALWPRYVCCCIIGSNLC